MGAFTTFDLLALGTVIACIVVSTMRGMISELFHFCGWIISLLMARLLSAPTATIVFPAMQPRALAVMCSFVLVFMITRILQQALLIILNSAISKAKLTSVNRIMGGILGALKGILFVSIGVFACSFSSLPQEDGWRNAASAPFFESIVNGAIPYLPEIFANQVHFPQRNNTNIDDEESHAVRYKPSVEHLTPKGY